MPRAANIRALADDLYYIMRSQANRLIHNNNTRNRIFYIELIVIINHGYSSPWMGIFIVTARTPVKKPRILGVFAYPVSAYASNSATCCSWLRSYFLF